MKTVTGILRYIEGPEGWVLETDEETIDIHTTPEQDEDAWDWLNRRVVVILDDANHLAGNQPWFLPYA